MASTFAAGVDGGADDDDYLELPPPEEDVDMLEDFVGDDNILEEEDDGDGRHIIPRLGGGDPEPSSVMAAVDGGDDDFAAFVFQVYQLGRYSPDQLEDLGSVTGGGDDRPVPPPAEALKEVEAPSLDGRDCPICLEAGAAGAWKETACGHRFHGRCVERWLQAQGSCPMCRRRLLTPPPPPPPPHAAIVALRNFDIHVRVRSELEGHHMGFIHVRDDDLHSHNSELG